MAFSLYIHNPLIISAPLQNTRDYHREVFKNTFTDCSPNKHIVRGHVTNFVNIQSFILCTSSRVVEFFGVVLTRYKCYKVTSHRSILACYLLSIYHSLIVRCGTPVESSIGVVSSSKEVEIITSLWIRDVFLVWTCWPHPTAVIALGFVDIRITVVKVYILEDDP